MPRSFLKVREKLKQGAIRSSYHAELVAATAARVSGGLRGRETGHKRRVVQVGFWGVSTFPNNFSAVGKYWVACNQIFRTRFLPLKKQRDK